MVQWTRVILGILSVLQYIFMQTFWNGAFYWFFIWIILFNLLWFYVEKPLSKKIIVILIGLFALINTFVLPQTPYLMLALYIIDLYEHFEMKPATAIFAGLSTLIIGLILWNNEALVIPEVFLYLGIAALAICLSKQQQELRERETLYYEQMLSQTALKEQSQLLKSQMGTMEELSIINERNRISRDLHDSVGHTLSTIIIQLAAISKLTKKSNPEASQMLSQLQAFTKDGLTTVRQVIHEMKPVNYQKIAFTERLKALIDEFELNSHIQVYFNANEILWYLNEAQEALIFRAVQEFLGNTSKHSNAEEIRIQYHFTNTSVILTMQDNGEGTDSIKPQMGLGGMDERARLLGGKVSLQSASGKGFKVRIVLPKGGLIDETNTD